MTRRGQPLWFLGVLGAGWVTLRAAMLWPIVAVMPDRSGHAARPTAVIAGHVAMPWIAIVPPPRRTARRPVVGGRARRLAEGPPDPAPPATPQPATPVRPALAFRPAPVRATETAPLASAPLPPIAQPAAAATPSRWQASIWALVRGAGNGAALNGPELGGSQAGVHLTYALGARRRLALAARLAAPLGEAGREAAIGLEWQPFRAPVRLVLDQRIALDRAAHGGPELGIVAGYGPHPLALGFDLAGYGQAGAIRRARLDGYADGQARFTRPVTMLGKARLELGAGAWAAVQTGARRLDLGPTADLAFAIAGRGARLALDWRQRVIGNARPASGPALTLGGDF